MVSVTDHRVAPPAEKAADFPSVVAVIDSEHARLAIALDSFRLATDSALVALLIGHALIFGEVNAVLVAKCEVSCAISLLLIVRFSRFVSTLICP